MTTDPYLNVDTAIERLFQEWKKYGKIIIALDFDDTIYDYHKKGFTYPRVVELVRECQKEGCFVVIFTGGAPETYPMILEHCDKLKIRVDAINKNAFPMPFGNHGKIYFNILLDDRAGLPAAFACLEEVLMKIQGKI